MLLVKLKNFEFLDSFRGLACLSVMINHSFFHYERFSLMSGFYFGVIAFFLLSAFLLTYRLIIQYEAANYKLHTIIQVTVNYFITRFFRIYVTLVIFCVIYAILEYAIFGDKDQMGVLFGAVMLNRNVILSGHGGKYGHLWTIPIEVGYLTRLHSYEGNLNGVIFCRSPTTF